jgi:hypothetical protein
MPRVHHKIRSHHAFSAGTPDPKSPERLELEKMARRYREFLAQCQRDSARLDALETSFKDPEAQAQAGARAGIKSGKGTEESMRQDNERLQKQLSRPAFAAAYFVAQRHTFMARKRQFAGLPQRRLA